MYSVSKYSPSVTGHSHLSTLLVCHVTVEFVESIVRIVILSHSSWTRIVFIRLTPRDVAAVFFLVMSCPIFGSTM